MELKRRTLVVYAVLIAALAVLAGWSATQAQELKTPAGRAWQWCGVYQILLMDDGVIAAKELAPLVHEQCREWLNHSLAEHITERERKTNPQFSLERGRQMVEKAQAGTDKIAIKTTLVKILRSRTLMRTAREKDAFREHARRQFEREKKAFYAAQRTSN